ncbi:hypothetical protein [Burkholderia lata]|uniref:hypothetical protein n=1 Tax=Burkholderia lata (strain ATCC 17760 / DSM 23089 / LMG 22485 / NCIMB 9086 / R18194 / 383) TaxID=482957 RepID=UPI0015836D03|nr:hypothetical protein [Burkholderia lata]
MIQLVVQSCGDLRDLRVRLRYVPVERTFDAAARAFRVRAAVSEQPHFVRVMAAVRGCAAR